jgi:ABC-type transporter Mla MlaB component
MTLLDDPQVPLMLSSVQTADGGETLSITGYLDTFTVPALQAALLAATERSAHPKSGALTLELSCVRFIDRAGLELLRRVRDAVKGQRALTVRLRPGSQPETIFRASALADLLTAPYQT